MGFSNRDFLDKLIYFKHGSTFYIYVSAVPDEVFPQKKDLVRAVSIAGLYKIEVEGEGCWYRAALQSDLKLGFG